MRFVQFRYKITKDNWIAMRSLADGRSLITKWTDKYHCEVIWNRNDYITEAEKQLVDKFKGR